MKTLKNLFLSLFVIAFVASCENSTLIDDSEDLLTGNAITGGLLSFDKTAIAYVVGDGAVYTASGSVYQGKVQTTGIDVYKSFTSSTTGESTNEELLESVTISNTEIGQSPAFETSFSYEDLISGLTLGGNPLPTSDSALSIGDFFTLRFVSTLSTGEKVSNGPTVKVSVGTRFAGSYRPVYGEYYRIGVLTYTTADWEAFCPVTVIESVDATTYRVVEYFGPFNGNEWYFQIDENDIISYPDETPDGDAQLGNGQPFITCESNASEFSSDGLPCGSESNYVVRDNVNGADQLHMTFGYFTDGSGPRTFYQILEKIVD